MLDVDECVMLEFKSVIEIVLLVLEEGVVYSCVRWNLFLGCFMCYSGWYFDRVIWLYLCE